MNLSSETWHRYLEFPLPRYLGIKCYKNPLDLWVYQEILWKTRPKRIVETGTMDGGPTLYLAHILDHIGDGIIYSIDIENKYNRPQHKRICYLTGDSKDLAEQAKKYCQLYRTMVILDSCHEYSHVLAELRAYAPLVSPGCYLVCEDTDQWKGNGARAAVEEFLQENTNFVQDRACERFVMTTNPGGWLRRK